MTDTWAAKVLEGVPRHSLDFYDRMSIDKDGAWMHEDDVLAAIARMGAGDDMVERLLENDREIFLPLLGEAAAHIADLTAQVARATKLIAKMVPLSADGNFVFWDGVGDIELDHNSELRTRAEAAESESADLRARVARLEGALGEIEADCNAAYPPSHGAIKYAIRLALEQEKP